MAFDCSDGVNLLQFTKENVVRMVFLSFFLSFFPRGFRSAWMLDRTATAAV